MDEVAARALDAQVAGCAAAHQRLLASLAELSDADARADSMLPGWSRGHVLNHLARNADSHARMFEAATRGQEAPQYPGGMEGRVAEIEAGDGSPSAGEDHREAGAHSRRHHARRLAIVFHDKTM